MTEGVQESTAVVEKSTANESLDNFSIHFFHPERSVCALLYENFYEFPHVSILKEDLAQIVSDTESKKSKNADCLFCPVSSTFVHLFQKAKGTGISSSQSEDDTSCEFAHQLIRHLGDPFKGNLFRKLSEEYYDEPPLGTTFIMETGAKTFPRYVAWTITDILEEEPTPLGIYNAMRSALIAVLAHNRKCTAENKLEAGIRGVASPIFGFRAANLTLENGLEVVPDAALIAMVKEMREGYASIASGHPANLATKVFILKKLLDTNLTETTSLHRENQILQEQVLSGALEARGFCTKKELAQLIAWVRLGAQSHMPKVTEASAKVLAAMIRNSDRSDFVLSREYISKQIMAPNGCFSHFFTLAQDGVFEVHNEIKKVDLEFGDTMQKNTVCSVYKGKYKGMNVAIKSYHPDLNEIPDFSKEFRAEAALMSMVQHPSLVPFLGAASRKPDFFIVTRLMKESLYDTLRDNTLDLPMLAKLMLSRQVSVAVAYLHELELVHRDLKSKNVLIGHSLDEVVLCDFGLARIVNRTEVMTSNVGTIAWIAPEVLSGQKYGEAADVYSLGIVIWEIFTRKLPFEDIPSFQIPLVVTRGDRPTIPKDMPPKVVKLLKACWDAKPQKRPPASLVVAAIDQLIVEQGGSFQSVPIRQSSSIDFSNKSTPKDSPTGSPLNTNRSHHTSTTQGNNTPHNHSPVGSRDSTMHSFQSISASSSRDSTGSAISRNSSGTATDSTKRCRASKVPIHMDSVFQPAESLVELYFNHFERTGTTVSISDERYLMLRSTSLSYEFLSVIQDCCGFKSSDDGKEFAYNLLFEFGQYVGKSDATNFAAKTAANLHLARAAVPALSHLGMGFMEIQPESSLTPDEHCLLIFREPFSFEADTYKDQTSKKTSHCVCCFNSGFVSGWMAEAYDVPLVTVELTCRARGDASCEFVMASQDKIESYTQAYIKNKPSKEQSQYSHFKMPGYIKSRLTSERRSYAEFLTKFQRATRTGSSRACRKFIW
eukprot:TRINITY_DN2881_c0_g1_i4.p1 TRINITY_DN2881_c0_g1~~TRINITY_DN2881_c0_g1_i4.p1  ORF type:complete len:997 (+),score=287.22 TRINITY_DN2881_c0_g1_i4:2154-5144(+)